MKQYQTSIYRHGIRSLSAICFLAGIVSAVPLDETFELTDGMSGTLGSLHNQNEWKVLNGNASVQSNTVHNSAQAVEIQTATVQHGLSSTESSAWISFWAYYTAAASTPPNIDTAQSSVAFFINTNQNLVVYSNTVPVELSLQIPTASWVRYDVYCDYETMTWNLNVNGTNAAAGLPLLSNPSTMTSLLIQNDAASPVYMDDILVADLEPATQVLDTDADGIADWWEQKYFGGISAAVAGSDADLDGHTVLEEYIGGLNPGLADQFSSSMSAPREFTWQSVSERLYSIYWTPSLDTPFTLLQGDLPWTQSSFTDTNNTGATSGFYRLEARIP